MIPVVPGGSSAYGDIEPVGSQLANRSTLLQNEIADHDVLGLEVRPCESLRTCILRDFSCTPVFYAILVAAHLYFTRCAMRERARA